MKIKSILITIAILLIIPIISADLRVTLTTPQATFQGNSGDSFEYYIGVVNKNPFQVNISILNPESGIIFNQDTEFILQPNESREIDYTITASKSASYTDYIPVMFSGNGSSFGLQQTIYFKLNEIPSQSQESGSSGSSSASDSNSECVDNCPISEEPSNETQENNSYIGIPEESSSSTKEIVVISFIVILLVFAIYFTVKRKLKSVKGGEKDEEDINEQSGS